MASTNSDSESSDTEMLASGLHRAILGVLLAILAMIGLFLGGKLLSGNYLVGGLGVVLFLGAGGWILALFLEGLAER